MENRAPLGPAPVTTEPPGLTRARRALWTILADQTEPVSTADLVGLTGLHENTVRGHLEALLGDGLVVRHREDPDGRGRPAWLWRTVNQPNGSEYAGLAAALARTLKATSAEPVADATAAGLEWGREISRAHPPLAVADTEHCHDRAVELLEEFGFGPDTTGRTGTSRTIRLTRCPLLAAAREDPDVVCAIHRGLIQGSLPDSAGGTTEVDLVPFAEPGACILHLREENR